VKVVLTEQSLIRLEKSLRFYLEELEIPKAKVIKIKDKLIAKAKSLSTSSHKGLYEPYLSKLKKGY